MTANANRRDAPAREMTSCTGWGMELRTGEVWAHAAHAHDVDAEKPKSRNSGRGRGRN